MAVRSKEQVYPFGSTINDNETDSSGAGIFVGRTPGTQSRVAIANTTISGNQAKVSGGGLSIGGTVVDNGAIQNVSGDVYVSNVTITNNIADSDNDGSGDGGGVFVTPTFFVGNTQFLSGQLTLINSILAGNFDNTSQGDINPDISGAATGNANNLLGSTNGRIIDPGVASLANSIGEGSDLKNVAPRLGALQDNVSNSNEQLVTTNIENKTLTLNFLENQSGTADITVRATANGENVDDIFTITVNGVDDPGDDLPVVINPIIDLTVEEDANNEIIDLSDVFDDIDSDTIELEVVNNTNSNLVTALLEGNDLTLDFAENQSGAADITIRATADGESVEDTFTVTVGSTDDTLFNTKINRFQNNDIPGTYLFADETESENIRANFPNFTEEGFAFNVADEPAENLIPLYRFQSLITPGTYLFAKEEERQDIKQNFSEAFTEEGLAFYVYDVGSGLGTEYTRFQNQDNPGTYLFANPEETERIKNDFPNFVEEGAAFEVVV